MRSIIQQWHSEAASSFALRPMTYGPMSFFQFPLSYAHGPVPFPRSVARHLWRGLPSLALPSRGPALLSMLFFMIVHSQLMAHFLIKRYTSSTRNDVSPPYVSSKNINSPPNLAYILLFPNNRIPNPAGYIPQDSYILSILLLIELMNLSMTNVLSSVTKIALARLLLPPPTTFVLIYCTIQVQRARQQDIVTCILAYVLS